MNNQEKTLTVPSNNYEGIFNIIKPNDICIDLGANIGIYTEKMAEKGAIVYAFEPNPYAFELLKNKFLNNSKVTCFQKAVYTTKSTLKLYLHENSDDNEIKWSTGSSLLDFKGNILPDKFVNVDVIDFDKFINQFEKIKLVKMDVEGVEFDILEKIIESKNIYKIDKLYVETHEKKIPELIEKSNNLRKKIKKLELNNISLDWI